MKTIQNLLSQKDSLTQSGFNEILYTHVNGVKNENVEIAKNQGKIEGILTMVNNIKPETNEISAIWHSGYYRGMDQVEYVRQTAYEDGYHRACDDMSCPAGFANPSNNNRKPMIDKIPAKPENAAPEVKNLETNKNEKPSK